ncbi:MAG: hypothetical protein Q7R91_00655 [bacterium]|nr:hypothetical protein [bacterium]
MVVFLFAVSLIVPQAIAAEIESTAPLPIRQITITFLVDHDWLEQSDAGLAQEFDELARFSTKVYEKEFGIVFAVGAVKIWEFSRGKAELNIDKALRDVTLVARTEPTDITIGITNKIMFHCESAGKEDENIFQSKLCPKGEIMRIYSGFAYINGNAAVVSALRDVETNLIHEIAHLFGAIHTDEISVMQERDSRTIIFDKKNHDIIMQNRMRVFERMFNLP